MFFERRKVGGQIEWRCIATWGRKDRYMFCVKEKKANFLVKLHEKVESERHET